MDKRVEGIWTVGTTRRALTRYEFVTRSILDGLHAEFHSPEAGLKEVNLKFGIPLIIKSYEEHVFTHYLK